MFKKPMEDIQTDVEYSNNCFLDLYREILPRVLVLTEFGAMTEGNIPGTDKKTVIIVLFLPEFVKKLTKTKLFEFSQDTNREELKIRKNEITLQ